MRNGSFEYWRFRLLILGSVALLSVVTFASPFPQAQEPLAAAPAAQTSEPEFKLRVQENVVVVRVVVRDSKGRTVGGLRKEDFRITDNKKPQKIGSFSVETSEAAASPAQPSAAAPASKAAPEATATPVAPVSYLAFYIDDLYSAQDSLYRSGQAAEKFLAGLPASERVAIFASSGFQTLDFTDDRRMIHEALMKLRANTRVNPKDDCPEINDYMAFSVVQYGTGHSGGGNDHVTLTGGAIDLIKNEALNQCGYSRMFVETVKLEYWSGLAEKAYNAYMWQSRAVLKNLEGVIDRVARMPGEWQVMLVSDGFMDLEMNNCVESVVDRALRAHVTISALDGGGLRVDLLEVDASSQYAADGDLAVQANAFNFARRAADQGTLAEIAEGTGGQFFHDNNDLLAGMRKILLPPEVSYVLTFSPTELKADGTFHALNVALANGHGLTIQARKGYFAPKLVSPEEVAKTEIREAIYSSYPLQDLPLTFETEVRKAEGQNVEVAVQAVLDIRNLPFQKQGDLNLDNVVFAVSLFDHDGKYVTGSQQTYSLSLKDSTRLEMEKRGLALKTHVSAKVGAYTLRVVLRDSQGGKMVASSKTVEVPL
jgi:VWFA-related protein